MPSDRYPAFILAGVRDVAVYVKPGFSLPQEDEDQDAGLVTVDPSLEKLVVPERPFISESYEMGICIGWLHETSIYGGTADFGWSQGWDAAEMVYSPISRRPGLCHSTGYYGDRLSGEYDGRLHCFDLEEVESLWRLAYESVKGAIRYADPPGRGWCRHERTKWSPGGDIERPRWIR
jgi:hypothetical protein